MTNNSRRLMTMTTTADDCRRLPTTGTERRPKHGFARRTMIERPTTPNLRRSPACPPHYVALEPRRPERRSATCAPLLALHAPGVAGGRWRGGGGQTRSQTTRAANATTPTTLGDRWSLIVIGRNSLVRRRMASIECRPPIVVSSVLGSRPRSSIVVSVKGPVGAWPDNC